MGNIKHCVLNVFAAPSCLNTSIDNLVMKPRTRWKTDKSDRNFQKRPNKLGRTNLNDSAINQIPSNFDEISRALVSECSLFLLAPCLTLFRSFSRSFRIELRTGNNTNRNQETNIAPTFLFVVKFLTSFFLSFLFW